MQLLAAGQFATQLKIAQMVVTVLMAEQCRNQPRSQAKLTKPWERGCAVTTRLSWLNKVVQRTMLFTFVSTMLFSIDD